MRLLTSQADVATYTFNKHRIKHHFCKNCGIHPYAEAVDAKGNPLAAINIRCLPDVHIGSVPIKSFDGKSL